MPLQPDYAQDFVNIKIINVDTETNVISKNGPSDVRVRLDDYFDNIVAMEIENYQVPYASLSQFTDENKIDFQLRNPNIFGGQWKDFTATIAERPVLYNTPELPLADLLSALTQAFSNVILKDPDFGGKVDIVPIPDAEEKTRLLCRTLAYPPAASWPGYGSTECILLFDTGLNKNKSAANVLGFDRIDITMATINIDGTNFKNAVSPRPALLNKYRFVDLTIDEFPEFEPFHRIYVPTLPSNLTTLPENTSRVRLLTKPPRLLKELTLRIRLPGNKKPTTSQPYYFSFRVFELKSSLVVPEVDRNRIKLN